MNKQSNYLCISRFGCQNVNFLTSEFLVHHISTRSHLYVKEVTAPIGTTFTYGSPNLNLDLHQYNVNSPQVLYGNHGHYQ